MPLIESAFQKMVNDNQFFHYKSYFGLNIPLYKYTIELLYDNREIPDKYVILENGILCRFPKVYKKLGARGDTSLIIKMLSMPGYKSLNVAYAMRGAAKIGNIQLLEFCHVRGYLFDNMVAVAAAKANQFETIKWLEEHHKNLNVAACGAAKNGNMEMVRYLFEKNYRDGRIGYFAALNNHFDVIKFLHLTDPKHVQGVISGAGRSGNLDIIKYALELGFTISDIFFLCEHIHIWKWLIENNICLVNDNHVALIAGSGNLECLQYIYSKGYDVISAHVFNEAVCSRNLDMIIWLHDIGAKVDETSANFALEKKIGKSNVGGSLAILELFVSWGYDLSIHHCWRAALNGNLEILQYQYLKGCSVNKVIKYAAINGHLHIIIWCRKQGFGWNATVSKRAARHGQLDILKWLRGVDRNKYGIESDETEICPWDERVCSEAASQGHIDVLMFALENECNVSDDVLKSEDPIVINCVKKCMQR